MHRPPFILTAVILCALAGCNRAAAPNATAPAGGNSVASSAPAAPDASANGSASASAAAPGNGLWGVAEEEDAASHRGVDFIAFNRTGRTLTALAIRPDEGPPMAGGEENPWSDNILAQTEVPDETRAAAHFEPDIEICRWSLRATFTGGQTRDYPSVNLCNTIRVDLR
jgi:hypothetical protein